MAGFLEVNLLSLILLPVANKNPGSQLNAYSLLLIALYISQMNLDQLQFSITLRHAMQFNCLYIVYPLCLHPVVVFGSCVTELGGYHIAKIYQIIQPFL